jgi:antirestriction protein ArdC
VTFNQIKTLGGSIHAGEKSRIIVFTSCREKEEDGETVRKYFLRYYHVWNTEQTTIEVELPEPIILSDDGKLEAAESLLKEYTPPRGPRIVCEDANQAYYQKFLDIVNMPHRSQFHTMEGYYQVLFHELIHSTGHESRMARKELGTYFGGKDYSKEELTAEMGAAFLSAYAGMDSGIEQSAAYIESWLSVLGRNPLYVIHAASAAQRAVEYVRNQMSDGKEETTKGAIAA